jgi:4'-phosphopantetheinyl transferase
MAPGWLTACAIDVPDGDAWLSVAERRVLSGLRIEKRRSDWRLGRWAAKQAVAEVLRAAAGRVEVLAATDGAPEAWLDGARLPLSLSLSHRSGRALAVVGAGRAAVGCDLELVETRSGAFVREWFAPAEQSLLATREGIEHARLANLLWTAKEAAAKVRREGLRLDVRGARVELDPAARTGTIDWRPLRVLWPDAPPTDGWWRDEPGWVMAIAGTLEPPLRLARRWKPPGCAEPLDARPA